MIKVDYLSNNRGIIKLNEDTNSLNAICFTFYLLTLARILMKHKIKLYQLKKMIKFLIQ